MSLQRETFRVRGEFIALDALLKATGIAPSGGSARQLIVQGDVRVNGVDESRKTRKIRPGDRVETGTHRIDVQAAQDPV